MGTTLLLGKKGGLLDVLTVKESSRSELGGWGLVSHFDPQLMFDVIQLANSTRLACARASQTLYGSVAALNIFLRARL